MSNERDKNGRFALGGPGGPGRPKRDVERDYLAALSEGVSLAAWRKVVARALSDAQQGDSKSRNWLTRYLIGDAAPRLIDLAASELRGATTASDIEALASKQERDAEWVAMTNDLIGKLTMQ